jgi:hypothetical protein
MKRDVTAIVAIGVAILVMAVAIVVAMAGPAQAEQDLYLGMAESECQQALAALENREWARLIGQLTVPGQERSSLSMHIAPVPEGQAPRAVKREDVVLVHAFRAGGDSVMFTNMDGGGWCTVRAFNMVERAGKIRPEWVVEAVSLAGVGDVRRGADVIARK